MSQTTQSIPLVDGQDGFEIVRDQICAILATETAAQVALATAASKPDPTEWAFKLFKERTSPWEAFQDGADQTPIVNVWFDDSQVDEGSSNTTTRQMHKSRFNIDMYVWAETEETAGGHTPGDELSAIKNHRILRLVRNILMHDKYEQLGKPTMDSEEFVCGRKMAGFTAFIPQDDSGRPLHYVRGARITLEVMHNETVDLEDQDTLEIINVKFYHEPGGDLIAELEYDHSGP